MVRLLQILEGPNRFHIPGTEWSRALVEFLMTSRHALQRLGFNWEASQFITKIKGVDGFRHDPLLRANVYGHYHSANVRGGAAMKALAIYRRHGKSLSMAGFGDGRFIVYAVESQLHRGRQIDEKGVGLDQMTLKEAILAAVDITLRNGDFDGAMRAWSVIARGYLYERRWEKALSVVAQIRAEIQRLGLNLPHAEMRLALKEHIAELLAAEDGQTGAMDRARSAYYRVLREKRLGGGIPVLSLSHASELMVLKRNFNIQLDLSELVY